MDLVFVGGGEKLWLKLDRAKKKAQGASSKTFYKLTTIPWKNLFDKGKEEEQEKATDTLTDEQFQKAIILEMAIHGYVLENVATR